MSAGLSTLAEFDDIRRCQAVLYDGTAEEQFLRFAALQEECRLQWLAAVQEAQRLQRELDDSLKHMSDLETKLFHARRILDMESKLRKESEYEKDQLEKKLIAVANLIQESDIQKETREKFEFIKVHPKKRKSRNIHIEEKYGNDINSTGSFLSDLSVTQSEDDFIDGHSSRVWKKHQPSFTKESGIFVGAKPTRSSRGGGLNESKTKIKNNSVHQKHVSAEIGPSDKICATTKVSIPTRGDGPILAESIIEAVPSAILNNMQPITTTSTSATPLSSNRITSTDTKSSEDDDIKMKSPKKQNRSPTKLSCQPVTPSAPLMQEFSSYNITGTPVYNLRRSIMRGHCFASKTFIKSDACTHCQKKIRFGSLALKCKNCRVCVHTDCKEVLTVACVPTSAGGTPTFKGVMGYLTEYAPSTSPMIPAIIIHCVNEIEKRGFSEIGIYRVSGSEREVKSLKEKFLRGKSVPHLGNIDVHVLCGCIKDFLRSLREPLVPTDLWSDFSNAIQSMTDEEKRKDLFRAIDRLPQANRDTLAYLVLHFQRIGNCEDIKMPLGNIARIFGPTIVGYSSPDPDRNAIFSETTIQFQVMENLMNISSNYWSQFISFGDDGILNGNRVSSIVPPPPPALHTPKNDGIKSLYATPFKGSLRKDRKFYATPPYPNKKK